MFDYERRRDQERDQQFTEKALAIHYQDLLVKLGYSSAVFLEAQENLKFNLARQASEK